jgi:hypothetical protein
MKILQIYLKEKRLMERVVMEEYSNNLSFKSAEYSNMIDIWEK